MNNDRNSPLSFKALEDGLSISFSNNVLYSIDDGEWNSLTANEYTTEVNKGSVISFKEVVSFFGSGNVGSFSLNKECNVFGNCASLLPSIYDDQFSHNNLYLNLFRFCSTIIDASGLILPAITLANGCYSSMFSDCTSLVNAPELPATTLANGCYSSMFSNCTSLVNAPELPATTLADNCYNSMFNGCTKLNYIKAMFMTTPSTDYTSYWVYGVSTTGTFVKSKDATWDVRGASGIPNGWTVETE